MLVNCAGAGRCTGDGCGSGLMTISVVVDGLHDRFHWNIRCGRVRVTAGNGCEGHGIEQQNGEKFARWRCAVRVFGSHEKNDSREEVVSILY